jgi:hypothetical protein
VCKNELLNIFLKCKNFFLVLKTYIHGTEYVCLPLGIASVGKAGLLTSLFILYKEAVVPLIDKKAKRTDAINFVIDKVTHSIAAQSAVGNNKFDELIKLHENGLDIYGKNAFHGIQSIMMSTLFSSEDDIFF